MRNPGDPIRRLGELLGADRVSQDPDLRAFLSTDIRGAEDTASAIVRPASVDQLQETVEFCYLHALPVIPRGGGMSYTGGYAVRRPNSVILDTRELDAIEINRTNGTVTVEAGTTWQQLDHALERHGLRTPFYGPFSGNAATIGGSLAQHSLSLGSASYGISADNVINVEVVTGKGELLATGSLSVHSGSHFLRYFGPDLTGLFLGDCGSLGIKARATLRTIPRFRHRTSASFAFASFEDIARAMAAVARLGVADCNFGNDPVALEQMMSGQDNSPEAAKAIAKLVFARAPNAVIGAARILRLAVKGKSFLRDVKYNQHVIVDGHSLADVRTKIGLVRKAALPFGREIANIIPTIIGSDPYIPLPPPKAENLRRGVPQHAIVPFDGVGELHARLQSMYEAHAEPMARAGVSVECMYSTISTHAFLYEPVLTWPDTPSPFSEHYFKEQLRDLRIDRPENTDARELVRELQSETAKLFSALGAANFQIGKAYPYWERLKDENQSIIGALKSHFDPKGILNPGALGLPEPNRR